MATSGTTTFNLNVAEMTEEVAERLDTTKQILTADWARSCRRSLNLLFRDWDNIPTVPWKNRVASQAVVSGVSTVTMPTDLIEITSASLRRDGVDIDLMQIGEGDYQSIPNKSDTGRPDRFWLHKLSPAVMYLWQTPENSTDTIEYWSIRRIEDVTAAIQNVDGVQRWLAATQDALTLKMFDKLPFSKRDQSIRANIEKVADDSFDNARDADRSRADTVIIPGFSHR